MAGGPRTAATDGYARRPNKASWPRPEYEAANIGINFSTRTKGRGREMTEIEDLNEPAGTAELQRLNDRYRKQNIANDRARELVEEQINSGHYSYEQADEMSAAFEQSCRDVLEPIQREIEAHCAKYNLRSNSSQWADE